MKYPFIILIAISTLSACGDIQHSTQNSLPIEGPQRTDPFEATACDQTTYKQHEQTLTHRNLYVFGKMNQLLRKNDALRAFVGLDEVHSCLQAKQFVEKQHEYNESRPSVDPKIDPVFYPDEPIEEDVTPTIRTSQHAIMSGTASSYKSSVQLLIREGTVNGVAYANQIACTGTVIAPNVILTAAHCIYATGRRPVTVQYTATAGNLPVTVYGSATSLTTNAQGYRHPDYTGSATDDVGLFVLDTNLPSPLNTSSARTRIMTNHAWTNLPITFYGYGQTKHPGQSGNMVGRQHMGTNTIAWTGSEYYTVNANAGARACRGDSGMGSLRDTVQDHDMIVGIDSQRGGSYSNFCPYTNGFVRETKIAPKIGWLEGIIGPCNRYTSNATGISYRRCW